MGFFSWHTQDTDRSISNRYSSEGTFTVYMVNPVTDEVYKEDNYEGYGSFGGKDYYELLAEINGYGTDRDIGLDIEFGELPCRNGYPVLVEHLENAKTCYGSRPRSCENQGYFY